jgi:hypothetical protein
VRTYQRADGTEGDAVYVAAYAAIEADGARTMNIAFPLPIGNMTSVLHLEADDARGGVRLTTTHARDADTCDGPQGVYWVTPFGPLRLPLDETITVWPTSRDEGWIERHPPPAAIEPERVELLAVHDMWIAGMRYVRLTYHLARSDRGVVRALSARPS